MNCLLKYSMLAYINLIKSLCLSMPHFISTMIIHHTELRRMFHKIPIMIDVCICLTKNIVLFDEQPYIFVSYFTAPTSC
jgi:hypothetical protein